MCRPQSDNRMETLEDWKTTIVNDSEQPTSCINELHHIQTKEKLTMLEEEEQNEVILIRTRKLYEVHENKTLL